MIPSIAVQLYSLRKELANDFYNVVNEIAAIGYCGVEPWAGLFDFVSSKDAAKHFQNLGLEVFSTHSPLPLDSKKTEVLETLNDLNCKYLVSPWMDPSNYTSEDNIKKVAGVFNEANLVAVENGLKFGIHNHLFEFEKVNGTPAYQILLKYLDPDVLLQVDTYWVKVAGLDPVEVVSELGSRAPMLHLKDGPGTKHDPMTAVGQGTMDIHGIVQAGKPNTEWHIVEIDRCATNMITAIRDSYQYLTQNGLSNGKK